MPRWRDVRTGFGVRLKALRKEAGLSKSALAKVADCNRNTIANLEDGVNEPEWRLVVRLAYALEVTPNDFLPEISYPVKS